MRLQSVDLLLFRPFYPLETKSRIAVLILLHKVFGYSYFYRILHIQQESSGSITSWGFGASLVVYVDSLCRRALLYHILYLSTLLPQTAQEPAEFSIFSCRASTKTSSVPVAFFFLVFIMAPSTASSKRSSSLISDLLRAMRRVHLFLES